jgi:hypothetical protein
MISKKRRKLLIDYYSKHYEELKNFCKVEEYQKRCAIAKKLWNIRQVLKDSLDIGTIKQQKIKVYLIFLDDIPHFFNPKTKKYYPINI